MIDLKGKKINKLLVLERDFEKKVSNKAVYWICQCECGNIKSFMGSRLNKGQIIDCGCGKSQRISESLKNKSNIDTTSLIGKTCGKLTVLKRDLSKPIGHGYSSYWICKCECGNITSVPGTSLYSNTTQSCGCLKKELLTQRNVKDITDQRFGFVVAKERLKEKKHGSFLWRCECDCGNTNYLCSTEHLLSGKIHSCGCNKISYGEQKIEQILLDNNIQYIKQQTFSDLRGANNSYLRYDFSIIENDKIVRLIEFDGEQHYKDNEFFKNFSRQQELDNIKNNYAKNKGIPLVRIPYSELNYLSLELIMGNKYLIQ